MEKKNKSKDKKKSRKATQDDMGENFEENMDEGKENRQIHEDKKKSCFRNDNSPNKTRVKISGQSKNKIIEEEVMDEIKERRKKKTHFKTVKEPTDLKHDAFEFKGNKFVRKSKRSTTLVEKSKLSDKLLQAEMSLNVNQDILVAEEKGNPSKKYKPKTKKNVRKWIIWKRL